MRRCWYDAIGRYWCEPKPLLQSFFEDLLPVLLLLALAGLGLALIIRAIQEIERACQPAPPPQPAIEEIQYETAARLANAQRIEAKERELIAAANLSNAQYLIENRDRLGRHDQRSKLPGAGRR